MRRLTRRRALGSPRSLPQRGSRGVFLRLVRRMGLLLGLGLAGLVLVIVGLRWLPVPTSAFMVSRQIERLRPGSEVPPIRYQWVGFDRISPAMALAVIAAEDQRFPEHWGFDFNAIERSVEYNSQSQKVRGRAPSVSRRRKISFSGAAAATCAKDWRRG